jgi:hypothetical protein
VATVALAAAMKDRRDNDGKDISKLLFERAERLRERPHMQRKTMHEASRLPREPGAISVGFLKTSEYLCNAKTAVQLTPVNASTYKARTFIHCVPETQSKLSRQFSLE